MDEYMHVQYSNCIAVSGLRNNTLRYVQPVAQVLTLYREHRMLALRP